MRTVYKVQLVLNNETHGRSIQNRSNVPELFSHGEKEG